MRHIAIKNLYPDTRTINGESDVRDVNDLAIEIDEDLIQQELVKLQAEYDAQEYARNRKEEYDALNQFELISDDDANGTTTHKDAIAAIKTKWPKDNSGPK